jgi:hypothetical protein
VSQNILAKSQYVKAMRKFEKDFMSFILQDIGLLKVSVVICKIYLNNLWFELVASIEITKNNQAKLLY